MLHKHKLVVVMLLGIATVIAWYAKDLLRLHSRFARKTTMGEMSREIASSDRFWESGPNAERLFPRDAERFGKPLHDNGDGTFDVTPSNYQYRPVLNDGRRIRNDPNDSKTIILWDPQPLDNGLYLAMTAGLGIFEVTETEIAIGERGVR